MSSPSVSPRSQAAANAALAAAQAASSAASTSAASSSATNGNHSQPRSSIFEIAPELEAGAVTSQFGFSLPQRQQSNHSNAAAPDAKEEVSTLGFTSSAAKSSSHVETPVTVSAADLEAGASAFNEALNLVTQNALSDPNLTDEQRNKLQEQLPNIRKNCCAKFMEILKGNEGVLCALGVGITVGVSALLAATNIPVLLATSTGNRKIEYLKYLAYLLTPALIGGPAGVEVIFTGVKKDAKPGQSNPLTMENIPEAHLDPRTWNARQFLRSHAITITFIQFQPIADTLKTVEIDSLIGLNLSGIVFHALLTYTKEYLAHSYPSYVEWKKANGGKDFNHWSDKWINGQARVLSYLAPIIARLAPVMEIAAKIVPAGKIVDLFLGAVDPKYLEESIEVNLLIAAPMSLTAFWIGYLVSSQIGIAVKKFDADKQLREGYDAVVEEFGERYFYPMAVINTIGGVLDITQPLIYAPQYLNILISETFNDASEACGSAKRLSAEDISKALNIVAGGAVGAEAAIGLNSSNKGLTIAGAIVASVFYALAQSKVLENDVKRKEYKPEEAMLVASFSNFYTTFIGSTGRERAKLVVRTIAMPVYRFGYNLINFGATIFSGGKVPYKPIDVISFW